MKRILLLIAMTPLAVALPAQARQAVCAGSTEHYVQWPATGEPVWEMCYLRPSDSSSPRGSGLEIREVYYNGHMVFARAHAPMLFADYTTSTCYRDWKDTNSSFLADNIITPGILAEPVIGAVTTCDLSTQPDDEIGNCPYGGIGPHNTCHAGIAVERGSRGMTLTTQYSAAWYKYGSRATFGSDGSIALQFGFGNSDGTNSGITHWHHNYWRLDFDIDGTANNDAVYIDNTVQSIEFDDIRDPTGGPGGSARTWAVIDDESGRGFRLVPSAEDYLLGPDPSGRGHHLVHFMATQYHNGEYADNPNYSLGDCSMDEENLVDNENLSNVDTVVYYQTAVNDTAGVDAGVCKVGGPSLVPIGDWSPDRIYEDGLEDLPF